MKIRIHLSIIFAAASWLLTGVKVLAQSSANGPQMDPEIAEMLSTNPPPQGYSTRLNYVRIFTSQNDIHKAYRSGQLTKGETMIATRTLEAMASFDTFGKVIDQNGQPVAGVQVLSHLMEGLGGFKERDTATDANGLFHYVGLHGMALIMHFKKEGYEFNERSMPERPSDYLPDPYNPLIIHMWKLRGAEPMRHIQIDRHISCDGSVKRFDLLSSTQGNTGDLIVTLNRDPLMRNRNEGGKPFNWTATFAITNGGLMEIPPQHHLSV